MVTSTRDSVEFLTEGSPSLLNLFPVSSEAFRVQVVGVKNLKEYQVILDLTRTEYLHFM